MTIGILSLLYFVMYAVFVDLTNVFTYFWLILGVILALCKPLATIIYEKQIVIPLTVKWTGGIVIAFLLLIFIVTECVIIGYGSKEPQPDADYVLVLGAQVKGTRLTYALQTRLDTAYEYAINNPKTRQQRSLIDFRLRCYVLFQSELFCPGFQLFRRGICSKALSGQDFRLCDFSSMSLRFYTNVAAARGGK